MHANHRKCLSLLLPLALLLTLFVWPIDGSWAGDNIWTTTGPYGATVNGLAIDPNNNQIIYAATNQGLWKSSDGGDSWKLVGDGSSPDSDAVGVVIDPNDSSTIYVGTMRGVYKSIDDGATWEFKSAVIDEANGCTTPHGFAIAISPLSDYLYTGADQGKHFWCGAYWSEHSGMYRSGDGGETWEKVAEYSATGLPRAIVPAPSAPHIVYTGGLEGILRSTDAGSSWEAIDAGFVNKPAVYSLAVDPYAADVVYMGTAHDGIFKSTNGGQSWSPIGTGLNTSQIGAILIDPGNQQLLYAGGTAEAMVSGMYRSLDNTGLTWEPMMVGMGSRAVQSLAIDRSSPPSIYAGTSAGIWKYTATSGREDCSVSINDGALFTNQTAVNLNLTAPPGTTQMLVSNDGGFGDASWEPFATQKPWEITAYGNNAIPRVVYAKFKTHGQVSGLYQDDIVLDVNAPTGTVDVTGTSRTAANRRSVQSLTIPSALTDTTTISAHLPLVVGSHRLGFRQVQLLLSATDDVSGVGEMVIANDAGFTEAEWEPYATRKGWWVSDKGTATVYVKFRDRAGNESPAYSAVAVP